MKRVLGGKLRSKVHLGFLLLVMCVSPNVGYANAFEDAFLDSVKEELSPVNPHSTAECDESSPSFLGICYLRDPEDCVDAMVKSFCERQGFLAVTPPVCFGVEQENDFGSDEPGATRISYYLQQQFCSPQAAEAYEKVLSSLLAVAEM